MHFFAIYEQNIATFCPIFEKISIFIQKTAEIHGKPKSYGNSWKSPKLRQKSQPRIPRVTALNIIQIKTFKFWHGASPFHHFK